MVKNYLLLLGFFCLISITAHAQGKIYSSNDPRYIENVDQADELYESNQYKAAIREMDTYIARFKKENEAIASNKEIREELLR